ncbi:MAG: SDR family oxidoreductase, partial [Longimicrobiales bacterium]
MVAGLFEGKKVLVFGVANERSIAWGIARAMHEAGAELAFTFASEVLEKRVRPLAASVDARFVESCDVADDAQVHATFERARAEWDG